ncbi:glycosyltransferase family 4 protein [Sediminibacterium sp. C3]|uniref:glycosyltransferase family 4 protein n=1 Tax=Sediminibacterium sp. C3 TaxID=1267211 RepID=UPI00047D9776|nr:glycosyltransferase family 4 protein [Sediminibacterium sp. C3]
MEVVGAKRVLLIENFSSDFFKARLPLAKFLQKQGYEVFALVPNDGYLENIKDAGIHVIGYDLDRKNKGIRQIIRLTKIYKIVAEENSIDIVHSFRFQPNLLNVLANFFNRRRVVLHVTGLGIAFSNFSVYYLALRFISQLIFQLKLIRANALIVQNEDDKTELWFSGYWEKKIYLINGSGVNTSIFDQSLYDRKSLRKEFGISEQDFIFICVTRLILEKGIVEMTTAFQQLNDLNPNIKLWIVGWADIDNPRHVQESYIEKYKNSPAVKFLGRKDNVKELLAAVDGFIYPSYYREGIPRGILEALSMGLPILTTDTPGCKTTVREDQNGYLFKPRSSEEIKKHVLKLISNPKLKAFGLQSRAMANSKFSETIIFSQIEMLYSK